MPDTSRDFYLNRQPLILCGTYCTFVLWDDREYSFFVIIFQSFLTRYSNERLILFLISLVFALSDYYLRFDCRGRQYSTECLILTGTKDRGIYYSPPFSFLFYSTVVISVISDSVFDRASDSFERLILSNDWFFWTPEGLTPFHPSFFFYSTVVLSIIPDAVHLYNFCREYIIVCIKRRLMWRRDWLPSIFHYSSE